MLPSSRPNRQKELLELDRMMTIEDAYKPLSTVEVNRVDALCMGPADPERNVLYHAVWPKDWWKLSQVEIKRVESVKKTSRGTTKKYGNSKRTNRN